MSSDKRHSYSEWLAAQLSELHISQRELGEAVGKTQRTISRYVNGENLPDSRTSTAIADYIQRMSAGDYYKHMPAGEFAELLRRLMKEFGFTQEQLAQNLHKHQKDVSAWVNGEARLTTAQQEKILNFFLRYARPNNEFLSAYVGTCAMLEELLYPEEERKLPSCLNVEFGEKINPRYGVQYLLKLPLKVQKIILQNWNLFCPNLLELMEVRFCTFSELRELMDMFRMLPAEAQHHVECQIDHYGHDDFPSSSEKLEHFDLITQYRNVISADLLSLMKKHSAEVPDERYRDAFECNMSIYPVGDESFIDDMEYKLSLTRYEWYILMLLERYDYSTHSLSWVFEMLLKMCAGLKKV